MLQKKYIVISLLLFIGLLLFSILSVFFGTRALTAAERRMVTDMYQDSVDADRIRIKSGGPLTWIYPGITLGNIISFPEDGYDIDTQKHQALFIHEVCHVWQYQHFGLGYIPRSLFELFTQRDTYVVHYDANKSFRAYDVEEQCEIVAEYYLTQPEIYEPYIIELRNS